MATRNEIQLLNLAYFGRPSDPSGLAGWESTGLNSSELVLKFVATEEYQYNTLRPSEQGSTLDLASLINTYYNRLFDRSAAQSEINGWVAALNNGEVNVDYLGLTIANAGLNLVGTDLAKTLTNKIEKANNFSASLAQDQSINQKYTGWLAIDVGIEFNNAISETTTNLEADILEVAAFERLPDPGILIEVSESSSTVNEGNSVGISVVGFGPQSALSVLDYVIVGSDGFGAGDIVNGDLTGQITLDSNGNGVIQVSIEPDGVDPGESFTVVVSGALGSGVSTGTITVLDTPAPNATLQVNASSESVDEGDSLSFFITSTYLTAGTEILYSLTGVTSADVSNANLEGVAILDGNGNATVTFNVASDLSFEGSQTAAFAVTDPISDLTSGASVVFNDTTPPPALNVAPSSESVNEGGSLSFFITGTSLEVGTEVAYTLSGVNSADVDNAPLNGTAVLDADGRATVTYLVSEDLSFEGSETALFEVEGAGLTASASVVINDTTPQPALDVEPSSSAVDQGDTLQFFITSTSLAVNTSVSFFLTGVESSDVSNAPLSGTVVLDEEGNATVTFLVSEDLSFLGSETASFAVFGAGLNAGTSVVINDFTPTQAVLTEETDLVSNTKVPGFEIIATERTLGQNDQITSTVDGAVLNIGTSGYFDIDNFTTNGIETFEFITSDSFNETGWIDMRNAFGVENLVISRSSLDSLWFDDIQSAVNLEVNIEDSYTDFIFNFDSSALLEDNDSLNVSFSESPIDSDTDSAISLVVIQGPSDEQASLEILNLDSTGSTENVIDGLSVGDALKTLNIVGDADLNVVQDLGIPASFSASSHTYDFNPNVTLIDASELDADLVGDVDGSYFGYSSGVNGNVEVFGATGVNNLKLQSAGSKGATTNFAVSTQQDNDDIVTDIGSDTIDSQSGSDTISSSDGDDLIFAGNGDNSVTTTGGQNTITSLEGNDTIVSSGNGDDNVFAGSGNNFVMDSGGSNLIVTLDGDDNVFATNGDGSTINVGSGFNTVFAFGGSNTITSGQDNDIIITTGGNDSIFSGFGDDTVGSGGGGDFIFSEGGNNVINAGNSPGFDLGGSDTVITGDGNDTITVGAGNDSVMSGGGNDYVVEGNVVGLNIVDDGDSNFFDLGSGSDELAMQLDNLESSDIIDGGSENDTVTLTGGGVLRQSETLQTSNIEAFNLTGGGNFEVTLSEELIATSDDIDGSIRRFSVYTGPQTPLAADDTAGDVELDLTNISPISEGVDNSPLFNSIRYEGQNNSNSERVIVNDQIMNFFTELRFGERPVVSPGIDTDGKSDVLVVQDEAEITNSDLQNVDGLEVIELTATTNSDVAFTLDFSAMSIDDFKRLVGDTYPIEFTSSDDELLIRATPSLNSTASSTLNLILPFDPDAAEYIGDRITIEESAKLNVFIENEVPGHEVDVITALFFTSSADDLRPDALNSTVIAYQLSDVQAADNVEGESLTDQEIVFNFGLANESLSMQKQLNNVATDNVETFTFIPGAVNQAVRFDGTVEEGEDFFGEDVQTIFGLESIITSGGDDYMVNLTPMVGEDSFFYVDSKGGDDTITAAYGEDSFFPVSSQTHVDNYSIKSGDGDDFIFTLIGNDTINSGDGNDTIFSGDGNDSIISGDGSDIIDSGNGNNTINSGEGDDSISSGNGNDSIVSGDGNDSIFSGEGDDTINSGEGDDSIRSFGGNDSIVSGDGNDTIFSGEGDDTINSGEGDDTINSGNGNDSIVSGDGNDTIGSGAGDDIIDSGDGDDFINAASDDDTIFAGTGNDSILSGTGNDSILGGSEDDLIGFGDAFDAGDAITNEFVINEAVTYVNLPSVNFFTDADFVDGGQGVDIVAFSMSNASLALNSDTIVNVEQLNVTADQYNILTLDNSILGESKSIKVVTHDDDVNGNIAFNSESFVQGESVVFFDSDLDDESVPGNDRSFGAGDDIYANDFVDPSLFVTVAGNGGADTIALTTESDIQEFVRYNTGNDGGVAGASTGGDTINNFAGLANTIDASGNVSFNGDGIIIATDPGAGEQASGLLFDITQKQAGLDPGFASDNAVLQSVENTLLTLGGLVAEDFDVPGSAAIEGLAQNMLFLTGPAKSLTNAEITDAAKVAESINGVGVQGNDLAFGDSLPLNSAFQISQQTSQALIVQQGQTDTAVWVYSESGFQFGIGQTYTAEVGELRLLGTFEDALLTQSDFLTNQGETVLGF